MQVIYKKVINILIDSRFGDHIVDCKEAQREAQHCVSAAFVPFSAQLASNNNIH